MSDGEVDRKPLVNLRVGESQKEEWENYVENSSMYTSLSDLIRKSVEKEISEETEETQQGVEAIGEVQAELKSLSEGIEQLQKDVNWLRGREEHDVEELANELFGILPEVRADGSDKSARQMGTIAGGDPHTVDALADKLNTTPARVEEAIEFLKEHHFPIVRFDINGETHYFEEA